MEQIPPPTPPQQETQPSLHPQFQNVWRDLRWGFLVTFALTLILICGFCYKMLSITDEAIKVVQTEIATHPPSETNIVSTEKGIQIVNDPARIPTSQAMGLVLTLQVSFVMIVGFTCIFYGLMMTCLGVTAAYDIKGSGRFSGSGAAFSLASNAPGLFFFSGGVLLIAIALFREVQYKDKSIEPVPSHFPPIQQTEKK